MPEVASPVKEVGKPTDSVPEKPVEEVTDPTASKSTTATETQQTSSEENNNNEQTETQTKTLDAPSFGFAPPERLTSENLLRKRRSQVAVAKEIPFLSSLAPQIEQNEVKIAEFLIFVEKTLIPGFMKFMMVLFRFYQSTVAPLLAGDNMQDLVPAVCGVLLCIFGGTFPLLIASVEAFRLVGYQGLLTALEALQGEYNIALEAHAKDEEEDLDGDGIADVNQIDSKQLFVRKSLLLMRTLNPDKVSNAFYSLNAGILAVLANLKMDFARAITLGATLGEVIKCQIYKNGVVEVVSKFVAKVINEGNTNNQPAVKPEAYTKWIPTVLNILIKIFAIMVAFALQTIISAFHSAVRGGHMAAEYGVKFLNRRYPEILPCSLKKKSDGSSSSVEALGYAIAGLGFLFQLWNGFGLIFPFSLLLLPATILEWTLSLAVTWF